MPIASDPGMYDLEDLRCGSDDALGAYALIRFISLPTSWGDVAHSIDVGRFR